MNIETVNELIHALESAGELTIREEKFLKLAKAYVQLAAENVGLKSVDTWLSSSELGEAASAIAEGNGASDDEALRAGMRAIIDNITAPATDSIYAGIKADGVDELAKRRRAAAKVALDEFNDVKNHAELESEAWRAEMFAAELRKGVAE